MKKANQEKLIVLNISGELFQTSEKTLKRFPETLLGNPAKRKPHYCPLLQHYFFDRNRLCFEEIFSFYQQYGKLRCPANIHVDIFEKECKFYQLPIDIIDKMKMKEGVLPELQRIHVDEGVKAVTAREKIWVMIEDPSSSLTASVYTVVSLIAIVSAISVAVLESVKSLRSEAKTFADNPWAKAELTLNSWFLLELIARFICTPSQKYFFLEWLNWVDFAAVLPYFVFFIVMPEKVSSLGFLRILRLVRVLRLFKLSKHSKRLQIVAQIIGMSRGDFALLMLCLSMLVILAGSMMYHMEGGMTPGFSSIPESLWWGMVTVTTVGYGDVYPMSIPGQIFSGFLMVFGALTMSLPVLAIVTNFELFYEKNMGDVLEEK